MNITTITVTRAAKVNLGNYENVDISVTMTAQVDEDAAQKDPISNASAVSELVGAALRVELEELLTRIGKSPAAASRFGV